MRGESCGGSNEACVDAAKVSRIFLGVQVHSPSRESARRTYLNRRLRQGLAEARQRNDDQLGLLG